MFSVCVVISVIFGLIQTAPLNYKDPFFANYDNLDYNEMIRASRNLSPKASPEPLFLKSLGVNSNSDDTSVHREDNFIKLPTLASGDLVILDPLPKSSYFEHGIQEILPLDYNLISHNLPIVWNGKYLQSLYEQNQDTYEADQAINAGAFNVEMDPYEVDLYPFVHTSLTAALNPVPPVHTLPPVYATHIHDTMPSLEAHTDYDIDVLNPENTELMPPNLRITRSRRGDFLDDLAHGAMMNNILPTMPIPFTRDAESSLPYQEPKLMPSIGQERVMAVYPASASNDCAIPILLGCSPNIIRGTVSNSYAEHDVPHEVSLAAYKEAEQINQNSLNNDVKP